ncbi:MAG TPA: TIGR04211 family SH3 domain-containing protein [Gammaproteobacteria bacterium]|nr:TIGR04211 family SH3 domain-containing protein [Gammaproteobacteria bacterium]
MLGLLLASLPAAAQTRYISDNIPVTLRSGPSLENRILKNLNAGVRVELVGADEQSGYSQVRVASDGTQGWILTRYLTDQPIARDRLSTAEKRQADAEARVKDLEAQVASLTMELASARESLEQATSKNENVTSELENIRRASANAVQLRDQNETLRQRVSETEERLSRLTMQNTELASQSRQQWFVAGAAVLFGGILIGLVAPHLKRKRRSSW